VAHKVDDMITNQSCAVAKPINEAKCGTTSVAKAVYVFGGWRRTMRRAATYRSVAGPPTTRLDDPRPGPSDQAAIIGTRVHAHCRELA